MKKGYIIPWVYTRESGHAPTKLAIENMAFQLERMGAEKQTIDLFKQNAADKIGGGILCVVLEDGEIAGVPYSKQLEEMING